MNDDLIKRQDAIDALGERPLAWTQSEYETGLQNQYDCDLEAIQSVSSAQLERKKGEWINKPDIYLDEQTWECSECGEPWIFIEGTPSENNANYCPYCGADMRGESNG